jgi:hypothetical protein
VSWLSYSTHIPLLKGNTYLYLDILTRVPHGAHHHFAVSLAVEGPKGKTTNHGDALSKLCRDLRSISMSGPPPSGYGPDETPDLISLEKFIFNGAALGAVAYGISPIAIALFHQSQL